MAFKLTKDQLKTKAEFIARLDMASDRVENAVRDYNSAVADTVSFRDGLVEDWDGQISDKSEKWQDGDAGQQAVEFKEAWEVDFDEIAMPDFEASTILDELPDEAG